jgi:hypothetical protein
MYVELTPEEERSLIERFAKFVVSKQLEKPAILFLEGFKPVSYVGSQLAMITIGPFLSVTQLSSIWGPKIMLLLEKRSNVELLLQRIDELIEERNRLKKSETTQPNAPKRRSLYNRVRHIFGVDGICRS